MQVKIIIGISFFLFFGIYAFGQSTRDVAAPTPPKPMYQAEKKSSRKIGLKLFRKKPQDPVAEFRTRMEDVAKQRKKDAKLAEKAQYNNPLYFGHKKPPKKRPMGKRKLCKVCLIVH